MSRHGALVLNTCQAVLKDPDAAEDAFQATFVLLFRKAGSIRGGDALGAWLHRVAYRTALQARSEAGRRREIEKAAGTLRAAESRNHDDLGGSCTRRSSGCPSGSACRSSSAISRG